MNKPRSRPTVQAPPVPLVPPTIPAANALITKDWLCAQTASHLGITNELARHRIDYAVKKGIKKVKLIEAAPDQFVFGTVALWLRWRYPGKFDDFPLIEGHAQGASDLPTISGKGGARTAPATLPECRDELDKAVHRTLTLEKELKAAREESARLRQPAQNWQKKIVEKNRESGRQGGRGKAK